MSSRRPSGPRSQLVRSLYPPLIAQARREIELTLQLATLLAMGYKRADAAELLKAPPSEVRAAVKRLQEIAPDFGDTDSAEF